MSEGTDRDSAKDSDFLQWECDQKITLESYKHTLYLGAQALRGTFLANGGGSLAILTLIGGVISSGNNYEIVSSISWSLLFFSCGIFLSVLGSCFSFMAQGRYTEEKEGEANIFQNIYYFSLISSSLFFISGILFGFHILINVKGTLS